MRKEISPELLKNLYWEKEMSQTDIAKLLKVSKQAVSLWMIQLRIPRRNQAEATSLAERNSLALTDEAIEFLEGCLLGDGSISMNKSISALYQHCDKHLSFLIWLRKKLALFGIKTTKRINTRSLEYKGKSYLAYRLTSLSYPELVILRKRWYPKGKKVIPRDLLLTPVRLLMWYLGDGSYRERRTRGREVRLCSTSFSMEEKSLCALQLSRLGILTTTGPHGLRVRNSCIDNFFDFIGPCPVPEIYGYKWPSG